MISDSQPGSFQDRGSPEALFGFQTVGVILEPFRPRWQTKANPVAQMALSKYNPAALSPLRLSETELMLNRRAVALGLIGLLICLPLFAQTDKDLLVRIRQEETNNSQIMKTEHMLTDVYGPRLTGSPNHKAAAEWAIKQMTAWGLANAHLEPWDFGHVGWLNERLTAHMISPIKDVLTCEVLAWTPSTRALVRANDAGREFRQIRAFNNRTFDVTKAVPTVVMRNEDYGRITRILADGTEVVLEFDIVNRVYPEGKISYNTVAEIPGTDKADEVIMLGGHLDSWHAATGATDNAIGCAIMMEAARILKTLALKPRRTIRVALWSGEEEGLLGSQAYVKEHFGAFESPKPGYEKFGGYFNIESGTGRIRGASVFGPPEDADILRQAMAPFADLGVAGAIPSKSRRLGGTDSTSFSQAGLPGIGLGQDPIEYFTDTWHTNLDTYERIIEDDVKKEAIVVAAAVYQLAMRDDMLPRFSKADMHQ